MKDKKNILIFPAGSEIGLEIHASLKDNKHFRLLGASSVKSHAKCVFENGELKLPFITASDFIDELNLLIEIENIDFVYPAHDEVILFLSRRRGQIATEVLCPSAEVCEITQYKSVTYDHFSNESFIPRVYSSISEIDNYPVFRKPSRGQNSIGAHRFESESQLCDLDDPFSGYVVTEFLPGREYTVDCFSTRAGELKYCRARERVRTKNGISMNSRTINIDSTSINYIAQQIVKNLDIHGAWFFQVREDIAGKPKLMEIAPRLAGTSVCARFSGVNTAALTVYDAMGIDVGIIENGIEVEVERALVNRVIPTMEFDNLVIDLDDTLISPSLIVNLSVLNLVYQYRERGKPVYLVTRHSADVSETLVRHHLCRSLFSKIIHLTNGQTKSEYFPATGTTLFVDDAYSERLEVSRRLPSVVAVDVDAVEGFLDYLTL